MIAAQGPGLSAPELLHRQLEQLADGLAGVPGVQAVVLMGSAARGELASCWIDGGLQHFGDIELMAVTEGRLAASRREAARRSLDRIAASFGQSSPLFHVDLIFRERSRLGALPPIIFTYELREAGRVLRGPNVLPEIPRITAGSLDAANTREILFKRLWALAETLPAASLSGEPLDALSARAWGVSLRRQALDVPTVLLPACGMLLAGYRARGAHWRAHPELPFRAWIDRRLGRDSAGFLDTCLAEREACAASADPLRAHRDALALIAAALEWSMLRLSGAEPRHPPGALEADTLDWTSALAASLPGQPRIFNRAPISRGEWLALTRQAVRIANISGVGAAIAWLRAARKAHLAAGLLHLHRALLAHATGRADEAARALDAAGRQADLAAPGHGIAWTAAGALPFPEAWLNRRAALGRAFWQLIRLGEPAAWQAMADRIDWPTDALD